MQSLEISRGYCDIETGSRIVPELSQINSHHSYGANQSTYVPKRVQVRDTIV
jgi:hypothetical protein